MKRIIQSIYPISMIVLSIILITACNPTEKDVQETHAESTPTPTENVLFFLTETSQPNPCDGESGTLEMLVLVGPSEAVGLEPVTVGNLPFTVQKTGENYLLKGGGNLTYEDILISEWGTYSVSLDLKADIEGECHTFADDATLNLTVSASGNQLVEVRSEGFSGDYPWSGSHKMDLNFPMVEGAQAEGEGWVYVLHLNQ